MGTVLLFFCSYPGQNTTLAKFPLIFVLTRDPDILRESLKRGMKTRTEKPPLFLSVFWVLFLIPFPHILQDLKYMVSALTTFHLIGHCCNFVFNHSVPAFPHAYCRERWAAVKIKLQRHWRCTVLLARYQPYFFTYVIHFFSLNSNFSCITFSSRYQLSLILPRSHTGTVWFYTSTSNKRAARPKLYTKSLTGDLNLMYSRFTLVRISIKL